MPCQIWGNRPEACRRFPTKPEEIAEFPDCEYRFDDTGVRQGECGYGGCKAHCCVNMTILGKKYAVCPFYCEA